MLEYVFYFCHDAEQYELELGGTGRIFPVKTKFVQRSSFKSSPGICVWYMKS